MNNTATPLITTEHPSDTIYTIDRDDRLIAFNLAWDAFARANGAAQLIAQHVAGQRLFDSIGGAELRHLHEVLLKRARKGHPVRDLPFRCDAPDLRRFMSMDIEPRPDGSVEYRCRTLRQEPRPPVALQEVTANSDEFLHMCSWCNKVRIDDVRWLEIEAAIAELGLLSGEAMLPISHGMCPQCLDSLYGEEDDGA